MPGRASEAARNLAATRWSRTHELVCQQCGTPFVGKSRQKWCSPTCRDRASYLRRKERG